MQIVHVQVQVKADSVNDFIEATIANVQASRKEPGIAAFNLLQQEDDPTKFLLIEVYQTPTAAAEHKATSHYATWRDKVAGMMAVPRQSSKFREVIPQ